MTKEKQKKENKDGYIVGAGAMLGVGVGFFLFHISVFWFLGSLLVGIGLGLIVEYLISQKK